jgi:UDP-N-acetylmuramoyl-tripeptide--D-alanyl-D-alanine ligase
MKFELFYETSGVCIDTRRITKDCLFICLKGANFNGNEFVDNALELGAKYVITDEIERQKSPSIIYVPNTLEFLQELARYHRDKFNIPIIGITGSNGKTTTKELIATVLEKKYKTLSTIGNLNNHIGVPLTLLSLNKTHEIAVIEMGANKLSDISELCVIANPTHGIITNIGKAHLEGFGNFEGVLTTKKELYDVVKFNNGILFNNSDDEILNEIIPQEIQHYDYSTQKNSYVKGKLISMSPFVKLKWESEKYKSEEISTTMVGQYNFYNFLAAITIGCFFNVEDELINDAIKNYVPTNNRSQIEKTTRNTLLLDAYNANPSSMKNSIESFSMMTYPNKIIIVGDMFELGKETESEHQKVIEQINQLNIETFFIGENFNSLSAKTDSSKLHFFKSKDALITHIKSSCIKDNLILLKASRGIGLETIKEFL